MKMLFVYGGFESYGIEMLSSWLREKSVEVCLFYYPKLCQDSIIDNEFLADIFEKKYDNDLIEKIREFRPDLIGFSVVSNFYLWSLKKSCLIKKHFSDIPIIFGGIHPTLVPELVIKEKSVDYVCQGDGEKCLLDLLRSQKDNIELRSIPNLYYKIENNVYNGPLNVRFDFTDKDIVPDKDLFYEDAPYFKYAGTYMFTRGCFYSCSFCCHSYLSDINRPNFMTLTPEKAISQIKRLIHKHDLKRLIFDDDLFVFNKKWSERFLKLYKKDIDLPFFAVIHPSFIDRSLLTLLKEAGCKKLEVAVQTFNEDIRKRILNRNEDNNTIKRALKMVSDSGIKMNIQHMMGIPGTNEEDEIKAALFYSRLKVKRIFSFFLTYYPKTKITDYAYRKNLISKDRYKDIHSGLVGSYEIDGDIPEKKMDFYKEMRILFSLIPMLPGFLVRFIIRKKRFWILKYISPLFRIFDLINVFINDEYTAKIYVFRYIYHLKKAVNSFYIKKLFDKIIGV